MTDAAALLRSLTPDQRARLEELVVSDPKASLWVPNPGPQALAYYSKARELFYGGAAGGGKSSLLAGLALTAHQRSLILRREATQLRGMLDDTASLLKTRDGLNQQAGQWRIPQAAALFENQLIEFGGVPDPGSEEKHQGIPHDLLAFDEVTQLSEYVVDYLTTWNRSTDPRFKDRCRRVLTSNPPTPSTMTTSRGQATGGGLWLVRRYAPWLDPQYADPHGLGSAAPGELRYYVALDGQELEHPDPFPFWFVPGSLNGLKPKADPLKDIQDRELVIPESRTFIPARIKDNPFLVGTTYESTLQKLPEPLRSAMLHGDFSVSLSDRPLQLIPTEWYRAATARWESLKHASPAMSSTPMTALAVDVSRGGGDKTTMIARHGDWFDVPDEIPSVQTLNGASVAGRVVERLRDDAPVVVDAAGVGGSVYDHMRNNTRMLDDGRLIGFVGSKASPMRDRSGVYGLANKRSEAYWRLRDALDPATPTQLAIPPHDRLMQEILVLTWKEESAKIRVLPKDQVQKLLGRSPDYADALVMALSVTDENSEPVQAARSARSERLEDAAGWSGSGYRPRPRWSDREFTYPERY